MAKFGFDGVTALVTGGARGIGRELTRQLVAQGAFVIVLGRNQSDLNDVVRDHAGHVVAMAADLTNPDALQQVIDAVTQNHPDLSLLINNAGLQIEADLFGPDTARLTAGMRSEIALNLEAPMALIIGLLPILRNQKQVAIVNVSSGLALAPKSDAPMYCATKAAIRSFSKGLRYQCQDRFPHIQVSEAIMALVKTDMTGERGIGQLSPQSAAQSILKGVMAGQSDIWIGKTKVLRFIHWIAPKLSEQILR